MSEGHQSAQRILRDVPLTRVDTSTTTHARFVPGDFEQRIEFAGDEPEYDLRGTTYEDDDDAGIVAIAIICTCLAITLTMLLGYGVYFLIR
jgi:hypothetical protein